MSHIETIDPPIPEAEAAKIDRQIQEVAKRISTGTPAPNDFSKLHDLTRRRADLLIPPDLRPRRLAR